MSDIKKSEEPSIKKKPKKKKPKSFKSIVEPREQVVRAVGGGLAGVLAIVALNYILWGINTSDSIIYAGFMIDTLSMGNMFNSMLGVWALSFTPLTSLSSMMSNWMDSWYYIFIPIIFAGIVVGISTKRVGNAVLGGVFFIFWGIVLPILFVFIFSVMGLTDPPLLEAVLTGILYEPLSQWNYDFLLDLLGGNIFLSWTIAGTLEIGIIVIVIAIIIGGIIQVIKR